MIFDWVHLSYYKCNKINIKLGRSYIDSPDWIKNIKVTISPINKKDNKGFQYDITATSNHEEIKEDPQRITNLKPFINKYNWEGMNYPSEKKWFEIIWEKQCNNCSKCNKIFCMLKKKKYISKHDSNREKQVIILMIPTGERWHYLAVKMLSGLLGVITSKHHSGFNCLNYFHSFVTESKRECPIWK